MSRMKFAIAGLTALSLAACATTPAPDAAPAANSDSTGSGTSPSGAQPTPPANQDGSAPQQ